MDGLNIVVGLVILVGLIGIVVPVLPGLFLVWAAVLFWASATQTMAGWALLAVATTAALAGFLLQYLVPGRRLRSAGISTSTTLAGAALALVGFFVVPVFGAFVGFPLGVYLAERIKLGRHAAAWRSTKKALKAIGLSVGIEMLTGLAVASIWVVGVVTAT